MNKIDTGYKRGTWKFYPDFFTMKNSFNRVSFGFCNFCQNLFGLQFRVLFRDNNNVKDELM